MAEEQERSRTEFVPENEVKILNELTGKIIGASLHLEGTLEFFIENYFVRPQNLKTFFFDKIILKDLSIEKKKDIFREICEREGFDKKKIEEVIDCIAKSQKVRNKLAHQEVLIDPFKKIIMIGNRKKYEGEILNSNKVWDEFENNKRKAVEIIIDFYQIYFKEGTIDEKQVKENQENAEKLMARF